MAGKRLAQPPFLSDLRCSPVWLIEPHYSLRHAAVLLGINRHTLKTWLAESGITPIVRRGSKWFIRESDLKAILEKRGGKL
jgi:hypothetical protein